MIIEPILWPLLVIFYFGGFYSHSPMAPKGVLEKNGNWLFYPLSPSFWQKINTLSILKLFILFQNPPFDFDFFRFSTLKRTF
jgi:hypothetical protein